MKDREQIRPFAILMTPWIKLESISMKMNRMNKKKLRIHIVNGISARVMVLLCLSMVFFSRLLFLLLLLCVLFSLSITV